MKPFQIISILAILGAILIVQDFDANAFSKKLKVDEPVKAPQTVVVEPKLPNPVEPTPNDESGLNAKSALLGVVEKNACSSYVFKNRGMAPSGYLKGIALVYARQICNPFAALSRANGPTSSDALTFYSLQASVKNTYALLIGLGMQESSGGVDCGRDMAAENVSGETAEAGAWQTSWNARTASPELPKLFEEYKAGHKQCYADVFVPCKGEKNLKNFGTGDGFIFQKLAKECPAFGAEFAALTLRTVRSHYGTINKKKAEYKSECVDLLTKVEEFVLKNQSICKVL